MHVLLTQHYYHEFNLLIFKMLNSGSYFSDTRRFFCTQDREYTESPKNDCLLDICINFRPYVFRIVISDSNPQPGSYCDNKILSEFLSFSISIQTELLLFTSPRAGIWCVPNEPMFLSTKFSGYFPLEENR